MEKTNAHPTIETVSLVGLGAIGSVYASRIAQHLPPDHFRIVASGPRAERYRRDGVSVNGTTFRLPIVEPAEPAAPADLLIFAVKFHQLGEAIEAARPHVGPDTLILSLLNGISSEEVVERAYGTENVLYSFVVGIDATRSADGTTYTTPGRVPFGEARNDPANLSERVKRLREFLNRVDIPCEIPEDMRQSMWKKFMLNVGVNQVSAVLGSPYGAIHRHGETRTLVAAAMREALAVSHRADIGLTEEDIADNLDIVGTLSPDGKASMVQDVEARRPTEVDIFGGAVVAMGQRYGIPTPVNEMLVRLIRAAEENYAR